MKTAEYAFYKGLSSTTLRARMIVRRSSSHVFEYLQTLLKARTDDKRSRSIARCMCLDGVTKAKRVSKRSMHACMCVCMKIGKRGSTLNDEFKIKSIALNGKSLRSSLFN